MRLGGALRWAERCYGLLHRTSAPGSKGQAQWHYRGEWRKNLEAVYSHYRTCPKHS
jgi:hypothetical protein